MSMRVYELNRAWVAKPTRSKSLDRSRGLVSVSAFSGPVGGLLANVNRWREQIGLGPVSETELTKVTSALDLNGRKATLVDMANPGQTKSGESDRLVAAIVPHGGYTWFFKLTGNNRMIETAKPSFIQFVQSVRYPND